MGVAHFGELGAEVEPVLVRDRAEADDAAAAQAVGEADLIYLSGGKPGTSSGRSTGSAVGRRDLRRARARRGPRRLLGRGDGPGRARVRLPARLLPWPLRWRRGLGLVAGRVGRARTTTPGRSRSAP